MSACSARHAAVPAAASTLPASTALAQTAPAREADRGGRIDRINDEKSWDAPLVTRDTHCGCGTMRAAPDESPAACTAKASD